MAVEATGQLRLVVDNHVRAAGVLRERHHQVSAGSGGGDGRRRPWCAGPSLQVAADAGVNVEYAYGTAGDGLGGAAIVLGVNDAARGGSGGWNLGIRNWELGIRN